MIDNIKKGSVVEVSKPLNGFSEDWVGTVIRVVEQEKDYDTPVVYVEKEGKSQPVSIEHVTLLEK